MVPKPSFPPAATPSPRRPEGSMVGPLFHRRAGGSTPAGGEQRGEQPTRHQRKASRINSLDKPFDSHLRHHFLPEFQPFIWLAPGFCRRLASAGKKLA